MKTMGMKRMVSAGLAAILLGATGPALARQEAPAAATANGGGVRG